jgi:hypothetical protein
MCEKCVDIDEKIERYRQLLTRIDDQIAHTGIGELIAELIAKKEELHPPGKGKGQGRSL